MTDNVHDNRLLRPFIIANMGLFIITCIWLYPAIASWLDASGIVNRQRQIYAAYHAQASESIAMQTPNHASRILPYSYLAIVLDDVQNLARLHGLTATQFTSSEPVSYYTGSYFVEVRAIATFTGHYNYIANFAKILATQAVFVRNARIEFIDCAVAYLRIEFSLFGRG